MTGAVATTAELPQTAAPTASRTASRGATPTRRDEPRTSASAQAITTAMTTAAGTPMPRICPDAEARPEQDDPEAQDALAGERDPRRERRIATQRGLPDDDPEQDRDRDLGDRRRDARSW